MEAFTYILLGYTLGLLSVVAYHEYIQWWQRRALKKASDKAISHFESITKDINLRLRLADAEAREDFEEAARIRDLIKKQP